MAININLKEIFSADSASDIASKLNFNFNQLLTLGIGDVGPAGPIGATGIAGPIGPIGPKGEPGPQIYSGTSGQTQDVSAIIPASTEIGDYFIGSDKIFKKIDQTNEWQVVTNFSTILTSLAQNQFDITWQLGITGDPASRILVLKNGFANNDRITDTGITGDYANNSPNWKETSAVNYNSQTVVFNFDPNTAKIFIDSSPAGSNGYTVNVDSTRVGAGSGINTAFPYTSLLSLYSFYASAAAATEAEQFGASGYRHQIELGSVDDITEGLVSNTSANYVISPTHQNLRIRKYRIANSSVQGGSILYTDYNFHAADTVKTPALNSRQAWSISKKTVAGQGNVTRIRFALSSGTVEANAGSQAVTGIGGVDGLHISSTATGSPKIALGFTSTTGLATLTSDSSRSIDKFRFTSMDLQVSTVNSGTLSISASSITNPTSPINITAGQSFLIQSGSSDNGEINAGETLTLTAGTEVSIMTDEQVSIGPRNNPAIITRGNRLNSAIPFALSTGIVPSKSSSDPNTLDEYQEGTFTPVVDWTLGGAEPFNPNSWVTTTPTLSNQFGYYTKIGNVVTFVIKFTISGFYLQQFGTLTSPGGFAAAAGNRNFFHSNIPNSTGVVPTSGGGIGNIAMTTSTTLQYQNMIPFGSERNRIRIGGIGQYLPGWPIGTIGNSSITDLTKYTVSLSASPFNGGNVYDSLLVRQFPFNFSVGGTGTSGTSVSSTLGGTYLPIDPATITAMHQVTAGPSSGFLELFGFRKNYPNTAGTSVTSANMPVIGGHIPIQSRVTIWDFLNYRHNAANGNTINFTINGSYLTGHQSVGTVYGGSGSNS